MSENPMDGFGSPAPELPEDAPSTGRDPKVLIGGGVALAVVAAIGAYLFLGGSSGSSTPAAVGTPVAHVATASPTPSVAALVPVGKPTPVVRTFQGDVGRDPFVVLVTSPPAPVVTTPAAKSSAAVPTAGITTSPGTVVGGVPVPLPTTSVLTTLAPPTVAPTTSAAAPVLVVLKAIRFQGTTPTVSVSFEGKSFTLKTGDTAGTSLKVMAIAPDDGTATFQLGDQTFDLRIGQSYVD